MLGQVVVDDENVFTGIHEVFAHRAARERCNPAQRRSIRRAHRDDGRVLHRPLLFEDLREGGNGRVLLADGDVDAEHVAASLVDDRVDRNRGLAGGAIADDKLALSLSDGNQRVDGADPGLQRLGNGPALHDAGRRVLDRPQAYRVEAALAVDGPAERIDDAPEQRLADRHRGDAPRPAHLVALLHFGVRAHDDDADVVLLEIERDALQAVRKLDELRKAHAAQAVDACEIRADLDYGADLVFLELALEAGDLRFEQSGDFVCVDHVWLSLVVSVVMSLPQALSPARRGGEQSCRRCGGHPSSRARRR